MNGKHKVPLMFFPAHGKHLRLNPQLLKREAVNPIPVSEESFECDCAENSEPRPTIIMCNPNALSYEHMVNYPHNFWLKYFMNHGNNVVVWNY